jgi:hypothetical protein
MIKLCVMCENCTFESGYHISDMTYENPHISCDLNPIGDNAPLTGVLQFHQWNCFAEQCDRFTLPKELAYINLLNVG